MEIEIGRGTVALVLDNETHQLNQGDSALYDLERRARWRNPTQDSADLLFVAFQVR